MEKFRIDLKSPTVTAFVLVLICGASFLLRTQFRYEQVFTPDHVRFHGVDAWYHVRLVENLVHHFPHRIDFDAYRLYPGGEEVGVGPFFDWLLGLIIWGIGLGAPTKSLLETVSAYFPAILGALALIPVYFVGKELDSRGTGFLAAAFLAVSPGQFLQRSLLGFTDHHVLESLTSTMAVLCLIKALKSARQNEASFKSLREKDWMALKKPLLYGALAGVALGCYLLTWIAGAFLVACFCLWVLVQYLMDQLRGRSTDYLFLIAAPLFSVALLMVVPFPGYSFFTRYHYVSLGAGVLMVVTLSGLSRLMQRMRLRRIYYPVVIMGLGVVGLGVLYFVAPALLRSVLARLASFQFEWDPREATITERRPLYYLSGTFSLAPVWEEFTMGAVLAPIAFGFLIYLEIKRSKAEMTLFLVWSLWMMTAAISVGRFSYYAAVNISLLAGYAVSKLLEMSQSEERATTKNEAQNQKKVPATSTLSGAWVKVLVIGLVLYPNLGLSLQNMRADLGPETYWYEAMAWLRQNTPEPFSDPNAYYARYKAPRRGSEYPYPASAYGVMSWWDYGNLITTLGRRIPNSNPAQSGARDAARFYLAQDESSANKILDDVGTRYVIVNSDLPTWHIPGQINVMGKLQSMPYWIRRKSSEFHDGYYQRTESGQLLPVTVYYPEYYRTLGSRLYLFAGQAVTPQNSTWVITYTEQPGSDESGPSSAGRPRRIITESKQFATYEEAVEYLKTHPGPNTELVGLNPFASCVPLEALTHYKLVYDSRATFFSPESVPHPLLMPTARLPHIRIFEYLRPEETLGKK